MWIVQNFLYHSIFFHYHLPWFSHMVFGNYFSDSYMASCLLWISCHKRIDCRSNRTLKCHQYVVIVSEMFGYAFRSGIRIWGFQGTVYEIILMNSSRGEDDPFFLYQYSTWWYTLSARIALIFKLSNVTMVSKFKSLKHFSFRFVRWWVRNALIFFFNVRLKAYYIPSG